MNNQSGYLQIEIIVVLAISAILAIGAGMTTIQMIQVTGSSDEHMTIARNTQNLGYWVSQDLQMAMTVNTTDDLATPETEFIKIGWKDWQTGDMYDVRYSWVIPNDDYKNVLRKMTILNLDGAPVNSYSSMVAYNIDSANISLSQSDLNTVRINALSGERNAAREYVISARPD
ncbi:MAG: prepilin-type N-terminal cleavage/methylation domain-containing protein [Dehalococcoidales bacterium]|nr:prepilin-type N-terminal cleavage/methylation domain-containing protein [Dehalococcoidales bacterium]